MAYSNDIREAVMRFRDSGHSLKETSAAFGVSISAIGKWQNLRMYNGNITKKKGTHNPWLFNSQELCAYIEENPNVTLREIATRFGGSISGAYTALRRENMIGIKKLGKAKAAEDRMNVR